MEAKFQKELNTPAFDEHQRNKSLDARRYNYRCWDLPLLREQREAYEKECKKGKGPDDRKLLKLAGQWHNVGTKSVPLADKYLLSSELHSVALI
jgi:hypothetical protein